MIFEHLRDFLDRNIISLMKAGQICKSQQWYTYGVKGLVYEAKPCFNIREICLN